MADLTGGHRPANRYHPDMSRAEDSAKRVELEQAAAREESRKAQLLIDEFVAEAGRRGIAPHPLRATTYDGHPVKTDKTGWYLRRNESLAIGADGAYYILTVPGGLRERWTGVKLSPAPPPLTVGKGGRDGESGDLGDFLQRRLDAG